MNKQETPPKEWWLLLDEYSNLALVRGHGEKWPNDANGMKYLKSIGIKTIIDLNNDDTALKQEMSEANELGIHVDSIPESGILAPNDKDIAVIEDELVNGSHPIYVHCQHGKDRSGLVIALYRVKHDKWTPKQAHDEWMSYGHSPMLFLMDKYFWDHVR